jgi:hypothetical protein
MIYPWSLSKSISIEAKLALKGKEEKFALPFPKMDFCDTLEDRR